MSKEPLCARYRLREHQRGKYYSLFDFEVSVQIKCLPFGSPHSDTRRTSVSGTGSLLLSNNKPLDNSRILDSLLRETLKQYCDVLDSRQRYNIIMLELEESQADQKEVATKSEQELKEPQ